MKKTWFQKMQDKPGYPKVRILEKRFPCYRAVEEVKAQRDEPPLSRIPWWRTLKSGGFLNDKYPAGQAAQKKLLEAEGHKIIARGKIYQLAGLD